MMAFNKMNQYGKRFSSTYQPKKNGRKPTLYNQLAPTVENELNIELSKEDYTKIQQWIIERNIGELIEILKDPRTPAFMTMTIGAILNDIKSGKCDTIERIYDRIFGKTQQTLQIINETNYIQKVFNKNEILSIASIIKEL